MQRKIRPSESSVSINVGNRLWRHLSGTAHLNITPWQAAIRRKDEKTGNRRSPHFSLTNATWDNKKKDSSQAHINNDSCSFVSVVSLTVHGLATRLCSHRETLAKANLHTMNWLLTYTLNILYVNARSADWEVYSKNVVKWFYTQWHKYPERIKKFETADAMADRFCSVPFKRTIYELNRPFLFIT